MAGKKISDLTDGEQPASGDWLEIEREGESNLSRKISWENIKSYFDSVVTTLTNKRVTPRVSSETSSATPTIDTDNVDAHSITALATNITSMTTNLSGTPTDFQKLIIRIKDNGSARTIAWGASFAANGEALPTTTVISKILTVGFIWNGTHWGCVASKQEA